jgi:hypothetical protein
MKCSFVQILAILGLGSTLTAAEPLSAPQALDRYLRSGEPACGVEERTMEVDIRASLPRLQKQGTAHGVKVISASGQVAYRFLRFTGDKLIKTDVIARFLNAEIHPPERLSNATSLENYKFHYKRIVDLEGGTAYVFDLRPRRKQVGLFKGELWLDAATGEPVHETGEFVKSPSVFIRRVRFVRDYTDREAQRTSITVETRLVGDAEMMVVQHPVDGSWQVSDLDEGNGR